MSEWTVGEIVGKSWEITKNNLGLAMGVFVAQFFVLFAIEALLYAVGAGTFLVINALGEEMEAIAMAVTGVVLLPLMLVATIVWIRVVLGTIRVYLNLARGEPASFRDLLSGGGVLSALGATLLISIGVMIGYVFFIIPGLIIAFGTVWTMFLIADKNLGAIAAIRESWSMMSGRWGAVLVWVLVAWLIALAGELACFVGLLVAGPVVMIGFALIYDRIQGRSATGLVPR